MVFAFINCWELFQFIWNNINDAYDDIDFNSIYFNARKQMPWKSNYEKNKINLLVHIRQGDTAVIETPWDTYIPVHSKGYGLFREFENLELLNTRTVKFEEDDEGASQSRAVDNTVMTDVVDIQNLIDNPLENLF